MLDLSNNNGPVNFERLHAAGTRRVYLKLTEGAGFVDGKHNDLRRRAMAAGLKVGEYHFARPSSSTPREEADLFLRCLPKLIPGRSLRPCLDLEDPHASPGAKVAAWAEAWLARVYRELGKHPIIYGSPGYLEPCHFKRAPARLWLASYGRNDGKEHPFTIPAPWSASDLLAVQYSSAGKVAGVADPVDVSHVYKPYGIDVHRLVR